jgi:hypothetical protein
MALVLKDRVKETTTSTGTGTITLAGAVSGFQSFSVVGNANVTYYAIVGQSPSTEWEVGIGTYTSSGTTLSRDTVLESSNSGSLVNFSAGTKDVFVTYPAEYAVVASNNFGTSGQVLTSNGANVAATFQTAAGGLTGFTAAESTASPNGTVYVDSLTASAASTNADVAFVAKGTGATLAQVPTSTFAGGDKRGTYATDFQKARSFASQVASGNYSGILAGSSNTASADYSFVGGGSNNTASGTNAAVIGGFIGTAFGSYASVVGGTSNTSNGQSAGVFAGESNSANASQAVAFGGSFATSNGTSSAVLGGQYGSARVISGYVVFPASNSPIEAKSGVQQTAVLVLGAQTTNATATALKSNAFSLGTSNQVILPNNSAYYFRGSITAGVTGAGNSAMWSFEGGIKRGANAASTVLVGTPVVNLVAQDAGASSWIVALSADTTNGGLAVTVTGQAATTIRWVCKVETTEMTF